METVRHEFATLPQVANASLSFEIPDGASASISNVLYKASQDSSHGINAESLFTDEKYLDTYKIPLIAGKFFNAKGGLVDANGVVINESAAKGLGWSNVNDAL